MTEVQHLYSYDSLWPYSERNSVGVERHIQSLFEPPEFPLDPSGLQEVKDFSTDILHGNSVDGIECKAGRNLELLLRVSVLKDVVSFDLDYFRTPAGNDDLARLGLGGDTSDDELKKRLYDYYAIDELLGVKGRKELATRTSNWRRDLISEKLAHTNESDTLYQPEHSITVVFNPEALLSKLQDLQAHRSYLRQVIGSLKADIKTNTRDAKIVSAEILLARTNNMAAELYPAAIALAKQLDEMESDASTQVMVDHLCNAAPFLSQVFKSEKQDDKDRISTYLEHWQSRGLRRIDYLTNGIGLNRSGEITPINHAIEVWADGYSPIEADSSAERVFSDEELTVMDQTVWGAEQTKQYGEAIIGEWNLLSAHQATWEEVDNRTGPAEDNKWQFVVTPRKKALAVNGPKKVVYVPEDLQRTLTQISEAGVIPLLGHETAHILQNEFDQTLAEQVPAAAIKGRRNITMRELGGVMEETEVQAAFGRIRPTNFHYLRALQVKEGGGNPLQVARSFYESLCPDPSEVSEAKLNDLRKQAADRSRRFYRAGGHDTQPLDYVEQGFIGQTLAAFPVTERKALAIAGGSFSLSDAALLHKYGLLELPRSIDKDPAQTAIKVFRRDFLPQLMTASVN
jgi:hypothetical protein